MINDNLKMNVNFTTDTRSIIKSVEETSKRINSVFETVSGFDIPINKMIVGLSSFSASISKGIEVQNQVINSIIKSFSEVKYPLNKMIVGLSDFSTSISKNVEIQNQVINSMIKSFSEVTSPLNEINLSSLVKGFENLSARIDNNDFNYIAKNTAEELKEDIKDMLNSINNITSEEITINNLGEVLDKNWQQKAWGVIDNFKSKSPISAFIIIFLVQVFILGPIEDKLRNIDFSNMNPKAIKTKIEEVFKEVDFIDYQTQRSIVNNFRIINKNGIIIRKTRNKYSSPLLKLKENNIIKVENFKEKKILNKRRFKNCLYVEYEDENGKVYKGWVNNIYTSKLST